MLPTTVRVSEDPLSIAIGDSALTLTPSEGLALAEQLARGAFDQIARESVENVLVADFGQGAVPGRGGRRDERK
jgi:hypothetical protein